MLKIDRKFKDYTVLIDDNFINGEFIFENDKESLAVLFLLMRNITLANRTDDNNIKWHEVIFNLKTLYDDLNIPMNRKNQKDTVIKSIESLIEYGVFQGDIDLTRINIHELLRLECQLINKNFTMVTYKEFKRIFEYKGQRINNFGLFNAYLVIKKYSNTETKTSYPSIDHLKFICNISSNATMTKYINILEELKLISCERGGMYTNEYGEIKKSNNIYTILID